MGYVFINLPQSPPSPAALLLVICLAPQAFEFTTLALVLPLPGSQPHCSLTASCPWLNPSLSVLRNLNGHLIQLSFRNLNPFYSFQDDKQPSSLCLNTSSNRELTTPQGRLILNSPPHSFLTYIPQFSGPASP